MTEHEKFEKWFDNNVKNFPFASEFERNAFKKYADIVWQATTKAAVPQWIPVSERLPAYGDDCLIVAEGKSEAENLVYEFTKDKFSSDDQFISIPDGEDYFYARNVSHWMPLPAAPVKDGE